MTKAAQDKLQKTKKKTVNKRIRGAAVGLFAPQASCICSNTEKNASQFVRATTKDRTPVKRWQHVINVLATIKQRHVEAGDPSVHLETHPVQRLHEITYLRTMSLAISEIWLHSSSGKSKLPIIIFFLMSFGMVRLWCLE